MSDVRPGRRLTRAVTLVPLALLSAAWTAGLTASPASPGTLAAAEGDEDAQQVAEATLGDAGVPADPIEAPASTSRRTPGSIGNGAGAGNAEEIVASSSTNGIPSVALSAYQRAETVINAADPDCHLTWQLVAAIGRVESNHGRFAGGSLGDDGKAVPAIKGPVLDGSASTSKIVDTDGGEFDGDSRFDRAVGPMQFIPSTWAVVGVDADDDGVRDPQDVDDAALGTAVYLCSGSDDLSTLPGQRAAVYRYNHSQSYVDLVLSIMDNYLSGDYTSVPNSTSAAGYIDPLPKLPTPKGGNGGGGDKGGNDAPAPTTPSAAPQPESTPDPQPEDTPDPTPDDKPDKTTKPPKKPNVPNVPDTGVPPVDDTVDQVEEQVKQGLSRTEATVKCLAKGLLAGTPDFLKCVDNLMNP